MAHDGVRSEQLAAFDREHLIHPQFHRDDHRDAVIFASGKGATLKDINGKEYIDGLSSLWNVAVGHGRAELAARACGETCRAYLSRSPATSRVPIRRLRLGVVLAAGLRRLRPTLEPAFLKDRRDLRVGDEALPALLIPVEDHPDPVVLVGILKDVRTLGPMLLSLLGALG